jgi:uncharacterized membrane protein YfcA
LKYAATEETAQALERPLGREWICSKFVPPEIKLNVATKYDHRHPAPPLGFIGGFPDASGGGGLGTVVTSNLFVQGADVRRTDGTVNSATFLVTLAASATFIATIARNATSLFSLYRLLASIQPETACLAPN